MRNIVSIFKSHHLSYNPRVLVCMHVTHSILVIFVTTEPSNIWSNRNLFSLLPFSSNSVSLQHNNRSEPKSHHVFPLLRPYCGFPHQTVSTEVLPIPQVLHAQPLNTSVLSSHTGFPSCCSSHTGHLTS